MPRKFRVHYRKAFYHVMLRGNNRNNIFFSSEDYDLFLGIIAHAADVYNCKIHLYCMMTNHIHLVIEVADIPISKIMQSISSRYARAHNEKYNKIGHLFQGRFKSKLISDDYYLIELCYYIHMNPVNAGICEKPADYRWSSHHKYYAHENSNWFLSDYVLKIISQHFDISMNYMKFINHYRKINFKPLICKFNENGNLEILNNVGVKIQNKPSLALENISLGIIAKIICQKLQIPFEKIASDSQAKSVILARSMIAYFAHYHAKYTFEDISAVLCRQPASISKTLHRHLKLADYNRDLKNAFIAIERELSISDVERWVC